MILDFRCSNYYDYTLLLTKLVFLSSFQILTEAKFFLKVYLLGLKVPCFIQSFVSKNLPLDFTKSAGSPLLPFFQSLFNCFQQSLNSCLIVYSRKPVNTFCRISCSTATPDCYIHISHKVLSCSHSSERKCLMVFYYQTNSTNCQVVVLNHQALQWLYSVNNVNETLSVWKFNTINFRTSLCIITFVKMFIWVVYQAHQFMSL